MTAWGDAKFGTIPKVIILVPLLITALDTRPSSFASRFAHESSVLLVRPLLSVTLAGSTNSLIHRRDCFKHACHSRGNSVCRFSPVHWQCRDVASAYCFCQWRIMWAGDEPIALIANIGRAAGRERGRN